MMSHAESTRRVPWAELQNETEHQDWPRGGETKVENIKGSTSVISEYVSH